MDVKLTNHGLLEAREKIGAVQWRLTHLGPVLRTGALDISALMANTFEKQPQSDPSGQAWEPLAESTIEARVRRGAAAKARDKSGKLTKSALKKRADRRSPGGIKKLVITGRLKNSMTATADDQSIRFGSNVDYLLPHQTGGKHLPRRMIAPVELRGNNWVLIRTGPAKAVWDRLKTAIRRYIVKK